MVSVQCLAGTVAAEEEGVGPSLGGTELKDLVLRQNGTV